MGNKLDRQEEELEGLKMTEAIEEKRMSIAQKRAIEAQMRRSHGRDWKQILGVTLKGLRSRSEAMQDVHSVDPNFREQITGRRR